jgi:hypothetical protein
MVFRLLRHTPKLRNLEVSVVRIGSVLEILSFLPSYKWDTISFVATRVNRSLTLLDKMDVAPVDT